MKPKSVSLALLVVALLAAALPAQAVDTFSNLDPGPTIYDRNLAYGVGRNFPEGFLFTATVSGTLSGIQIPMNNPANDSRIIPFSLALYTNNSSDELGSLLGSYTGQSTGVYHQGTSSSLVSISPTISPVSISAGSQYWLVASENTLLSFTLGWNAANTGLTKHYFFDSSQPQYAINRRSDAFSVQVTPVPEPTTFVALGLGGVVAMRRRRRV